MNDTTSNPQNTPAANQPATQADTSGKSGTTSAEVVPTFDGVLTGSAAPVLVLDRIEAFLDEHGLGAGPVEWERVGGGQSNITFVLSRGGEKFVLRRGPRPPLPKGTHNMVREARVQQAVAAQGVPVPKILAVGEDESILGVNFYIMEFLDGFVIDSAEPANVTTPADRAHVMESFVDSLVKLHSVDVENPDVARLGKPDGYLERQVATFTRLWEVNSKREVPDVVELGRRLAADIPTSQLHAVVHGDYRLGNVMVRPEGSPDVMAILDWEMATLGDPLADLGYFLATYAEPGAGQPGGREMTVMELSRVTTSEGYLSPEQVVERYSAEVAEVSGSAPDLSRIDWYKALALFKSCVFLEAMFTRWKAGERPGDDFAPRLEQGVPQLAARGLEWV
ncbi:phosphotransferase enzyme family [Brevibacterium mcbrellneri ATCC 49030]|uniref:Phosphotransferase enzyme family n=1 Tax=Brevibacterium mcbrellneri ATCC 49030 TaxID=585530 RepID=D4YQM0_9MICO|nr:phosphotransferase family protein [Brevibacterium mcbrellneri]EFG46508.1 phosphotransferase enzyme family [Brevibacterium mcbrellneri ATCC 49030]